MIRAAAGLLLALVVPACQLGDKNDVTVHNTGTSTVQVLTTHESEDGFGGWSDPQSDLVDSGVERTDSFPRNHRVRIHILHQDGTLLFSDTLTPGDFDDHDRHIHITVNP